jgi:hypothetical protein
MKINSPIYLSIVILTALGMGVPMASADDEDSAEAGSTPRVIEVDSSNAGRTDCACSHGEAENSNWGSSCAAGCGACSCGSRGYRGHRGLGLRCAGHSGQPLIDPYARGDWRAAQQSAVRSWHAGYYHTAWGQPVALMVSPHARMQTRWSWGVAQSTMLPIYHQYERPYPGPAYDAAGATGGGLLPTPRWPSHTDQFGVYYIRGPW